MKMNAKYYDVLARIRKLSHNRSNIFINRENRQRQLFEICRDYLLLSPDVEQRGHRTFLARLLYENLYRGLYLYLQGARFREEGLMDIDGGEPDTRLKTRILDADPSFLEVQKNDLKLQMGLWAYADASKGMQLRYLYGPHDLQEDRLKTFPHFYIKPFYCHEKEDQPGRYEFRAVDQFGFWEHSRTLYYGRNNIDYRELDFVQILQAVEGDPHWQRRTRFERDMDIIYASDGEMGACILSWLMLCIRKERVTELNNALSLKSSGQILQALMQVRFKINLENHAVKGFTTPGSKELKPLVHWISTQREENILFWLYRLGLIKEKVDIGPDTKITERGHRLLTWLSLYLRSMGGEVLSILGNKEPTYYNVIRGVQPVNLEAFPIPKQRRFIEVLAGAKDQKETLANEIYKLLPPGTRNSITVFLNTEQDKPRIRLMEEIIAAVNEALENGTHLPWEKWLQKLLPTIQSTTDIANIREPYCRRRIILEASFPGCIIRPSEFFPSWLDGIDADMVKKFVKAVNEPGQKAGVMELLQAVHLFIKWSRFDNDDAFKKRCRFNLLGHLTLRAGRDQVETASRAWLVFPVHYDYTDYQGSSGVTSVGYFLGTFKDSADNGSGYLDHFKTLGVELTERIFKIRQVIDILSQVENREIYIRDIYNIQIQEAMENQHRWTIHEIRNDISSIKGYINRFKPEDIQRNPQKIKRDNLILGRNFSEYEKVLYWVGKMLKGHKVENDERWVSNADMRQAYKRYARKLLRQEALSNLHDTKDKQGRPLFETNYEKIFEPDDKRTEYFFPFYTYSKLINELAKNIVKYADRTQKCYFIFHLDDDFLRINIRNKLAMNPTPMISTGKGLELFERFLKIYDNRSFIDQSGLINKNIGDECICRVKIAIKKGGWK